MNESRDLRVTKAWVGYFLSKIRVLDYLKRQKLGTFHVSHKP